jgi:outer membrane protein assembly factor BamB
MRRLVILLLAFVLGNTVIHADDWPQWMGPKRDGIWREDKIVQKFPAGGPPVVWRAKVGAGYSGPAIADGRVYVADRLLAPNNKNHNEAAFPHRPKTEIAGSERILCFEQSTGKQLWKHEYDCPYTISYPSGPRCTPHVKEGKLYTLGAEGHLLCLDAVSGKVLWQHDLMKDYKTKSCLWGHSAHPLIDGNKLICLVGGEGSAVVAFDRDTGKELWRSLTTKQIGYCPPLIETIAGKRVLLVWHAEAAAGLDPETGKVLWHYKIDTYQGMSIAMPVLWKEKVLLTAYPQVCVMLDTTSSRDPKPLWQGDRQKGLFSVFSTPLLDNGYIYGSSTTGKLVCLNAETGERKWETYKHLNNNRKASAEFFLTRHEDRYFLFTELGELIIAKLSPAGYEEVDKVHLLPPTTWAFGRDVLWCPPAFAGRCLFVRNDQELVCYSLAAP